MAIRTKEAREPEGIRLAAKSRVVALRGCDRRDGFPGRGIQPARAGIVSCLGDGVVAADRPQGDVGNRVEYRHVEADAIRHGVQAIDGVDPADVEDVEWA